MINWDIIDHKIFEDIAYEYMTTNYPQLKWEKTKLTNDGNKDGESTLSNLPLGVTVKYWYEAKFSINVKKSIPKSHLDSTLVSSILDGRVVVIAFITNAYISDDYKRRADIFAKQRANMRIIYINGDDIENWLANNPQIEIRFFNINTAQKQSAENKVEEMCFLDKYSNGNNQYLRLTTIELNKEYFLYVRIHSSKKQKIKLTADNCILFLEEYSDINADPTLLKAEKDYNTFFIPIKIASMKKEYCFFLNYDDETISYVISGVKILDLYKPKLLIASQLSLQNDINLFIKSNDLQNTIFLILGNAGTGKTYTLNTIRNNIKNPFSSIVFNFSGNLEKDIIICYKLFIYCQYGNLWDLNIDDFTQWNFETTIINVLNEINIGISSADTVEGLINYCTVNASGTVEQNLIQQQIYIDDVHKISGTAAYLLQTILLWHVNQRLNKRIFLFSRNELSNFRTLNEFLYISSCYIKEITKPTLEDVKCSIEANLRLDSTITSFIVKCQSSYNALCLYDLLCALKENINLLKRKDIINTSIEISRILTDMSYAEKNKIGSILLKEYGNNKIFCFIYKIENGIDINALLDFYGDSVYADISYLCQKRIIKEVSGKLYPFHDILSEGLRTKNMEVYLEELGEFILFCIENKYFNQSDGYLHLITLGNHYFWKYRSIAKDFRNRLYDAANYFVAEKIAKKIHEENQKDLKDYDYEDVKNLFILANCSKYTTSYELANREFERIKEIYRISTVYLPEDVLLETYSEIINNNLWMLNIKKADSDLKKMSRLWNDDDKITEKSKSYKYGYLNYYNRRMFCNFMLGIGSRQDYLTALYKAQELALEEYEGFAHMDYAKSIYNINIHEAKKLLVKAKEIFEKKGEFRRFLDASAEITFIDILQNKSYEKNELEIIYRDMIEKKYIQSATKTYLKLVIVMLLSDKYTAKELLEKTSNILVKNTSIASGKRHQAFVYHILAAIYYKDGDINQSKKFSRKSLELFKEFGDSYKKLYQNNIQIKKKKDIVLSIEWNSACLTNSFVLDIRVW